MCGGCDDDLETFLIKVQNKAIMESYADELFGLTRSGVLPEQEAHMADLKREMLGMPTAYVHVRHFPLIAFSIGKTGRRSIKEGYTPQFQPALTEDTVKNLKECVAALHTVVSKPHGHLLCVCGWGNGICEDDLRVTGHTTLPSDPADAKKWLATLIPLGSKEVHAKLIEKDRVPVSWRHFADGDVFRDGAGMMRRRENAFPHAKPFSSIPSPSGPATPTVSSRAIPSLEMGHQMGKVRGGYMDIGALVPGVEVVRALASSTMPTEEEPQEVEEEEEENIHYIFNIKLEIQTNPSACMYYTREPSWEILMALLEFMNATGSFDRMRMFQSLETSRKTGQRKKIKTGRPYVMPLLEDRFLIFMLVYTRFRKNMLHVANMFHVSVDTVERIYETWVAGVAIFGKYMMPMPSGEQLVAMTPARISTKLELQKGTGVVIGDATETKMEDPGSKHPAEHSAVYSEYKNSTTVKYLTACTLSPLSQVVQPTLPNTLTPHSHVL